MDLQGEQRDIIDAGWGGDARPTHDRDYRVAPSAPGPAPLLVPTDAGGNMDIAQLSAGAELHLPVQVAGALLSAGDADRLQGDGEVCGTGAETSATVRLRVDVNARRVSPAPWY